MKKPFNFIIPLILSFQINAKLNVTKVDSILNDLFDKNGPGGVALIAKDGKIIYRKAFGMANLELGVKMTPDMIFRVGSVTKQFTAAAIIQLAEQGKLDLTADITDFFPTFPTNRNKITIENLLTHTSGIDIANSRNKWTPHKKMQDLNSSDLVELIKKQPLTMKPGEREEYSNANYMLLGRIIEIVSGQSYQDYLQENIFQPLKMIHTSYDSPKRIIKNRAYGYDKQANGYENADYISMTQPFAAGAITSTVDDLAKWQEGLFNFQVISKESLANASVPFVLNNGDTAGYGYNWGTNGYNIQGVPYIKYNGTITGFLAATIHIPSEQVYVAILSNCRCNSPSKQINNIAALAINKPYEWSEIKLNDDLLKSYQGIYSSEKIGDRHIVFDNNVLKFYQTGRKKLTLYPFEQNKFFFKDPDYLVNTVEIIKNNGAIESVKMTSSETDKDWIKTDKKVQSYPEIEVTVDKLSSYVGKYELAPNFYLNVFIEQSTLYSQATGQNITLLRPYDESKFVVESSDIQITFNYNEDNIIDSITVHQVIDHHARKVE